MKMATLFLILVMVSLAENVAAQTDSRSFREQNAAPLLNFDHTLLNNNVLDEQIDHLKTKTKEHRLMDSSAVGLGNANVETSKHPLGRNAQQQTRGKDPIWNGAWIGAGVGAGFALAVLVPACQEWGCEASGVIVTTAVLAAAGAGIGALIDQALSVSPIVTKERKGAILSVTW
jgi:hypothetical protein